MSSTDITTTPSMMLSSLFSSDNKGGREDWTVVQALSLGDSIYVQESYDEAITAF